MALSNYSPQTDNRIYEYPDHKGAGAYRSQNVGSVLEKVQGREAGSLLRPGPTSIDGAGGSPKLSQMIASAKGGSVAEGQSGEIPIIWGRGQTRLVCKGG